ncbi:MAG: DUF354 domain-containing protein [Enterococcus sp.]|nr:DUF354 domain-containing protein [Enterococcus sp.]
MRILIDIGHPAHVHLFRNFAQIMMSREHQILFTCREKEHVVKLLEHYDFPFVTLGESSGSIQGKISGIFKFDYGVYKAAVRFKPDLFLSHGSHYAAHIAWVTGKPHIALEDTYNFEQIWLYKSFTKAILTGDYEHPLKSSKVVRFSGYHELAYLHPYRYKPDISVFNELGISVNEKYVILRFGSWEASHDFGHKGITLNNKFEAVKQFSQYAKVFISSESELPNELQSCKINIAPFRIHDALAYASLIFAESFTMPSEGSVLGTPAIVIHNTKSLYLEEQSEKYRLCYIFSESEKDQREAIKKGLELLRNKDIKTEWNKRRNKMLADKIDVTSMLVWFIENWPESFRIMQKNPDYQDRFK